MKKLIMVSLMVTAMLCASCTNLYKTIITITDIRDSIMTELGIYYRAGLISPELDAQIGRVDTAYREQALAAATLLRISKETGSGNPALILLPVKEQITNLLSILAKFQPVEIHTANLAKATKL